MGSTEARSVQNKTRGARRGDKPQRMDGSSWVEAALKVLAQGGVADVRVECLARDLGVTKGSFYHHFRNRDELLQAVLDYCQRLTIDNIELIKNRKLAPREALRELMRVPFQFPMSEWMAELESSIRLWGRGDVRARNLLAQLDQLVLRYLRTLFRDMKFSDKDVAARVSLAYAFMRAGTATPSLRKDPQLLESCISILTSNSDD